MLIDRRLVRTDWEKRRRFLSYEKLRAYIPNGFSVHFPHPLAAVSAALPFFPPRQRGKARPFHFNLLHRKHRLGKTGRCFRYNVRNTKGDCKNISSYSPECNIKITFSCRQIHICVLFLLPLRVRRSKAPSRGRRIPRFPYPYRIALRNIYLCFAICCRFF